MKGSWKTTSLGMATMVIAIGQAIQALLDGNPQTNPNYETVATAVAAGIGLMFARDNNKSSEDVGVKEETKVTIATPESTKLP